MLTYSRKYQFLITETSCEISEIRFHWSKIDILNHRSTFDLFMTSQRQIFVFLWGGVKEFCRKKNEWISAKLLKIATRDFLECIHGQLSTTWHAFLNFGAFTVAAHRLENAKVTHAAQRRRRQVGHSGLGEFTVARCGRVTLLKWYFGVSNGHQNRIQDHEKPLHRSR